MSGVSITNESGAAITGAGGFSHSGVAFTNDGTFSLNPPAVFDLELGLVSMQITFVTAMNASTVTNLANYSLTGSGGTGTFGNSNNINDTSLISGITYNSTTFVATFSLSATLPVDLYQITINGSAVQDTSGHALLTGSQFIIDRAVGLLTPVDTVVLDPGSDSGAPDHPGYTNDTTPTFDVQVNQAGTITMNFNGNTAQNQTLNVLAPGTYQFIAPSLASGTYTATATFNATAGGTSQNTTAYTIDTSNPAVTSMTPAGPIYNSQSLLMITYSELVDLNTFKPAAITLTGPSGIIAVTQPQLVSGSTYSIGFATQTLQGTYTLSIASSVADFAGNPMTQSFNGSFAISLPDLAVTATSSPSSAAEGGGIPVSWTVTNLSSTNPATSTWKDTVYLSPHAVLDSSAIPLLSVTEPTQSPLAADASYTQNESITVPGNLAAGSYYLLFAANSNGGQLVSSTANDLAAEPITLTAPDLQVTSVSEPSNGFNNEEELVSWTDQNTGTAAASGSWVDDVYAATDAQGDHPALLGSFSYTNGLAVGASLQRKEQVSLPATPGTYWLMVTANAAKSISEGTNYSNNTTVSATSTTVVQVPLPDLVVSNITPPANGVISGTAVPISYTITNQGTAPTSVPVWEDWVILSQDPTLAQAYQGQTGNDQVLIEQPVVEGFDNPAFLGVGQSYQQNVNVSLPISAQGTWYVYVVPDGTGSHHSFAMPELSRSDKLAISAGFSVTLSPLPDLSVTSVIAPAEDFSGQPMTLSWTVSNGGTGVTGVNSWSDAVYMSPDSVFNSSATELETFIHQGALSAGSSYTATQSVTLPTGVSGSFYFFVRTDVNGQVYEFDPAGDELGSTLGAEMVNLTPPPDLETSTVTAPGSAEASHTLTFSYMITNAGAGPTPNYTWNDSFYLSPTATYQSATAISLGQVTRVGSLAAGGSYTSTISKTIPNNLNGSYYLLADTDSGNVVYELDKTNNWGGSANPIQIASQSANLVVTSLTRRQIRYPPRQS